MARVNRRRSVSLNREIYDALSLRSLEDDVAMSRIVETLLVKYLNIEPPIVDRPKDTGGARLQTPEQRADREAPRLAANRIEIDRRARQRHEKRAEEMRAERARLDREREERAIANPCRDEKCGDPTLHEAHDRRSTPRAVRAQGRPGFVYDKTTDGDFG